MVDEGASEREFAAFCTEQHPRLVGVLALYTGDRDLAHDLAQEALARLWRDWRRLRRASSPGAYAYRTAINLANDHFRGRAVRRRHRDRVAARHETVQHDPDTAEAVAMRAAVAALPQRKRTALVLRYFADQTVATTAEAMGIPENTVKSLTRRALDDLRSVLAESRREEERDVC